MWKLLGIAVIAIGLRHFFVINEPAFRVDKELNVTNYLSLSELMPFVGVYSSTNHNSLTKETIILSSINAAYVSMFYNWHCHAVQVARLRGLVIAQDETTLALLRKRPLNSPFWIMSIQRFIQNATSVSSDIIRYRSPDFHLLTMSKLFIIRKLLNMGLNVLWTDTDIIFLKNPIPFIIPEKNQNVHIIFQNNISDEKRPILNTGLIWLRSSLLVIELWDHVIEYCQKDAEVKLKSGVGMPLDDQTCMNRVVDIWKGEKRLFIYSKSMTFPPNALIIKSLPEKLFPTGDRFFPEARQFSKAENRSLVVAVHANYILGKEKQKVLEKHQLWHEKCP